MKIKETTTYKIEMHSDDIAILEDARNILLKAINKPDIDKAFNVENLNRAINTLYSFLNIAINNDDEPVINTLCNGSYDNGYNDGKSDGYDDGYSDGYSDGRAEGYDEGNLDGYDEGYEDGYSACSEEMSEEDEEHDVDEEEEEDDE